MKNLFIDVETAIRYDLSPDSAITFAGFRDYCVDATVNRILDSGGFIYTEMVPKVFLEYVPILRITKKSASDSINRRFKKLVESGLVKKYEESGYPKPYYTIVPEIDRPVISSQKKEEKEIDRNRPGPGSVKILGYESFILEMIGKYDGRLTEEQVRKTINEITLWLSSKGKKRKNYESFAQICLNRKIEQNGAKTKIFDRKKVIDSADYIRRRT